MGLGEGGSVCLNHVPCLLVHHRQQQALWALPDKPGPYISIGVTTRRGTCASSRGVLWDLEHLGTPLIKPHATPTTTTTVPITSSPCNTHTFLGVHANEHKHTHHDHHPHNHNT